MSTIHQIYCTHCTHGNSALERREGELAQRMLGYSARAGSLSAQHLRKYYRQIERYIYYYLARDTPVEEKLRLTAATAPRRLIHLPSTSGLQLIAQICYRQVDTEGRCGSYFAHVLFREEKDSGPRWSQLSCLKLWGASGWVEEDSPDIPFLLPSLGSLDEMLRGERPAIDDGVLLSFLTTPTQDAFDDPGGVIPPRWRQKDPGQRSALFADAFRGLLETGASRSLLLVVEPSLAALWYYGMIRLLPPGPIRDPISFSTFDSNADRLATTLAAVQFHDPSKTDLRGDAYRGRTVAINTFAPGGRPMDRARSIRLKPHEDRRSEPRRRQAEYAETMVQRLLEEGFDAVDWRLGNLHSAQRVEDLEQLAGVDRLAGTLLESGQSYSGEGWPTSPAATRYLRQVLGRKLSEPGDVESRLGPLVARPAHLLVVELLAAEPETPALAPGVDYLLRTLPKDKIAALIKLEGVPHHAKVEVLARHVIAEGKLPPGCDHLWDQTTSAAERGLPAKVRLLPRVLARLDSTTLERFYEGVSARQGDAFVVALLEACRGRGEDWSPLTTIVGRMDESAVLSLYQGLGLNLFRDYPGDEPAMPGKLHEILHSLPTRCEQFRQRLDVVVAGEHLLPDDQDREIAAAWSTCRRAILEIGRLEKQRSRVLRRRPIDRIEAASRQMTKAIARALRPAAFEDDRSGAGKQRCLRDIGRRLLDGRPLLPPSNWQNRALWQKITWYFERGLWPRAPLRKLRPKSHTRRAVWWGAGGVVVVVVVTAAILLLGRSTSSDRPAVQTQTANSVEIEKQRAAAQAAARRQAEAERRRTEAEAAARREEASRKAEKEAAALAALEAARRAEEAARMAEPAEVAVEPADRGTNGAPERAGNAVQAADETAETSQVVTEEMSEARPPDDATAASGETVIRVEREPAARLKPPAVAQVRLLVTARDGKPLPRSFKKDFVFGCVLMEQTAAGFVRPKELHDVASVRTSVVLEGATAVRYRFKFFRRSGDPFDAKHTLLAETPWHVQPIEPDIRYTIKLELGEDQIRMLREHLPRMGAR